MNLLDAVVIEVLSEPEKKFGRWFVKVRSDIWGRVEEQEIMTNSRDEAEKIAPGYKYLT